MKFLGRKLGIPSKRLGNKLSEIGKQFGGKCVIHIQVIKVTTWTTRKVIWNVIIRVLLATKNTVMRLDPWDMIFTNIHH